MSDPGAPKVPSPLGGKMSPAVFTALRQHMAATSFARMEGGKFSIGDLTVSKESFVAVREELRAPPRAGELPHLLTLPFFPSLYPRAAGRAPVQEHPGLL